MFRRFLFVGLSFVPVTYFVKSCFLCFQFSKIHLFLPVEVGADVGCIFLNYYLLESLEDKCLYDIDRRFIELAINVVQ